MEMKKLCCLILGSATMLSLCACGNQNNTQSSDSSENSSTTTVDEKTLVSYHTPDAIKGRKELVVGVKSGGFEFFKNKEGVDTGYEVDLANAIAKEIGEEVNVKFVESEVDPMLDSLQKGEIDIALASLESNASLKERFTLSDSYWPWKVEVSPIYVLKSNEEKIKTINDISKGKIAVVKESLQDSLVNHYLPDSTCVFCDNIAQCIEKLKNGEVDAIATEESTIQDSIKDSQDIIKSNVTIPDNSEEQGLFIALMKDNIQLQTAVNGTISKHKENGDIENWIYTAYNNILSTMQTDDKSENDQENNKNEEKEKTSSTSENQENK